MEVRINDSEEEVVSEYDGRELDEALYPPTVVTGNIQVTGPVSFPHQNLDVCYHNIRVHTCEIYGTGPQTHNPYVHLYGGEVIISTSNQLYIDPHGSGPRWCIMVTTGMPTLMTDVAIRSRIDLETQHIQSQVESHKYVAEFNAKESARLVNELTELQEKFKDAIRILEENELGAELDICLVSKAIKKEVGS